ncbi:MAG: LexA family protein [Dehalococcoidia bacterium]|tara:strand:- start:7 stop:396 length:390 start_codon:yes stop_codon:yes gene_type:complete
MSAPFIKLIASAGFPSPAEDFLEPTLDLNKYLITNPPATFCVRVNGNSMNGARINSGDVLIVDRSLEPENNNIVLATLNGSFIVKKIMIKDKNIYLISDNGEQSKKIKIDDHIDFNVWGVVTSVINKLI